MEQANQKTSELEQVRSEKQGSSLQQENQKLSNQLDAAKSTIASLETQRLALIGTTVLFLAIAAVSFFRKPKQQ